MIDGLRFPPLVGWKADLEILVIQLISNKPKPETLTESPSSGGNSLALKIVVGCLLSLCFAGPLTSTVQAQSSSEYQVKAAFLYNFATFVDWPGDAFGNSNAPLVIGAIGEDPFGGALDQAINGKH